MHTVTMAVPARAHLARVPPTVNSWSSGWAWMLITRAGGAGSPAVRFFLPCSGTPGVRSRSLRPSCELGSPFALGDGVAPAAQDEGGPPALVPEVGAQLLQRETAEPRRERAAPDPAVEPALLALERGRVERLPVIAGQDELETVQPPSRRGWAAPAGRRTGCPRTRTSSARPGTPRASVPPAYGSWRAGRSGASGGRGPRSRRGRSGPRRRPGSGTRASPSHSSPARAAQSHRRTRAR